MNPVVAVMVRTKDRPLLLRRAMESILNQTYKNWEIVLINNGGDEGTISAIHSEFICRTSNNIRLINLQRNSFMEVATNVGLKNTDAKFVTLLDDDDTWDETFLEKCVEILVNNNLIDGVVTKSTIVHEEIEGQTIQELCKESLNPRLKRIGKYSLLRRNLFTTNSFVYRKNVLTEIGYYREDLPVLGDWEFNLRFALSKKIVVLPQALAFYHKRQKNTNENYSNTDLELHLKYDKLIRYEFCRRSFNEGAIIRGSRILIYGYFNNLTRLAKKMIHKKMNSNGRIEWRRR
ncbi:hypothetical protein BBD41_16935 [Paenibacillus ihbetae]|uniref:Glycosyltransferase 2-like domain-containing protein n=1 Tax=Paenibacillus ihbetae TaxID=1870820 RepID=A0A1B2E2J9_9BACL|nr:glycosyltransferase [Paenibacillus ihbetae]ANY74132.1 hypothetical protein BBD41_16935 [Paenibacillus ihbetae]